MQLVRALTEGGPVQGASTPSQTAITDTSALILSANPKRKGFTIQNTGTTVLKLNFGTTVVTQAVYHIALKGCTAANDGNGAIYSDDCWIGPVTAISSVAGGTCVIAEYTASGPSWNQSADWGGNY